ncbi:MAG TPA: phage baseplate assembly protein V [Candidatus Binataceae bacterium]
MSEISAFRVGIVKEQDLATARLRVVFPDHDQLQSYWLPVVVSKTLNDKLYWIPDVGEQVVCLMDRNDEDGAVLGAIYSKVDTTPVISADKFQLRFKDGTVIEYDRALHVLRLAFGDGTALNYDATAHSLGISGGSNATAVIDLPGGIVFSSGNSSVTINASGVSIAPPLPFSSTVAQT